MARGVIPGPVKQPRMPVLYVPPEYAKEPPARVCNVCGMEFPAQQTQAWGRHVARCAAEHIDEIRASTPRERQRGTPFDPDNWDPEVEEHMREVGRRMIREGRLEVLPHERAGH